MQINKDQKNYEIEPRGKKFTTICRTDGLWSITYISKNKRSAKRKGDEFVSGERTTTRKYVTKYGAAINEELSRIPRTKRNASDAGKAAILAMAALLSGNP